jgi:HemY protein
MIQALWFVVVLTVLVVTGIWLADHPGSVTVQWQGYRLDSSVALLLGAVAAVAVAAALIYRLWIVLEGLPSAGRRWRQGRRQRRGFEALTRGMVAVAAGDAEDAGRQGKRAEGLLEDPPLTLLLSAQAAQLAGDEQAAERFFKAMLERPGTEFLGLRGLLTQAIRRHDWDEALALARRAYRLRPKSDWVAANLLDLQVRAGQWLDAEITLAEAVKTGLVPPPQGDRRRAVLLHQQSQEAEAGGDGAKALKLARRAHDHGPDFVPAAVRLARLLVADGKGPKAAQVIEKTWGREPHPDLYDAYRMTRREEDGLTLARDTQRLAAANPDHPESHIALAEAALEARLWGEARSHLSAAAGAQPTARVCRLMARLEEDEHADGAAAREWLVRASAAAPDPAWVCQSCGNLAAEWTVLCGNCEDFDSFAWHTPPRVAHLPGPQEAGPQEAGPGDAGPGDAGPEDAEFGDARTAVLTHDEAGAR